ncbi:MAG: NAD(P)H-dependent oxidoreductase [Ekhidna sp.]|nr:NAD(P)H-dependent oxidoreductase [Ekhidna sp.]
MITIISGTNRENANSLKIARQYQNILQAKGQEASIIDLKKLPEDFLTNSFYENKEANEAFQPLMNQMKASQKFIFIVPEYNGSFPGILKLFIDALEFPETLKNKKCALVGLSAGVQGSVLAMSHLTDIFNYLAMHVLAQKIKLMGINDRMSEDGVTDEIGIQLLEEQAAAFINF